MRNQRRNSVKKVYFFCIMTSFVMCLIAFGIHNLVKKDAKQIKVGFIFVGDETTPYTENFIKARNHVMEIYGDQIECVTKYNVVEELVEGPLNELIEEQCDYIIASSYGYGEKVKEAARLHPEIQFCVPTGDNANKEPVLSNYHNCLGTIYQGRYICGVIAGEKLKEMITLGKIKPEQAKVGYVAAFPYAEVISGFTAFYLGVQSVVPEATMLVKYTNTWSDYSLEKQVANELIEQGCVVISQHSDTTGPAIACENADQKIPVYHVGYNQSMTDIAPTRSLVSCSVDFSYYFEQSIYALLKGKKIEDCIDGRVSGQDAMAGTEKGWVRILDLNHALLPMNIEEVIRDTVHKIEKENLQVFAGPFTGVNPYDENDRIDLRTPFVENKTTSSPQFSYILDDVITVVP